MEKQKDGLVIEGNAVYEMDWECMEKQWEQENKKRQTGEENEKEKR